MLNIIDILAKFLYVMTFDSIHHEVYEIPLKYKVFLDYYIYPLPKIDLLSILFPLIYPNLNSF